MLSLPLDSDKLRQHNISFSFECLSLLIDSYSRDWMLKCIKIKKNIEEKTIDTYFNGPVNVFDQSVAQIIGSSQKVLFQIDCSQADYLF